MYKVILCALLVSGCGLPFTIGQDVPEQTVPADPNPLPAPLVQDFIQIPLTIDLQSEIEKHKTGPAQSVRLKSLTLAATPANNPSGNFDFLDEVHIFIAPSSGNALPEVEIATLKPVPRGATSVSFTVVPDVDLLPYIKQGARITSRVTGHYPQREFTFNGHLRVTVYI
ncbi:MAG TPA: hypothetical protein VH877_34095 [Polyangia bacterium]|jgi:hypothetical protein|nr:hypothetical protein [Polyangia bacterium]